VDQIAALRKDAQGLTDEVTRLRRAVGKRTGALIAMALVLAVAVVLAVHTQAANERRIEQNNARWCPLFTALNPAGKPATTERGRVIAERLADLARDFHCPSK
jgi:hypothetical protein